jgi:RNA polymerase sigma-54 factor
MPGRIVYREAMALTQKLEIRQSQALVMTPQLMQAIKLLQLSNLDLTAYVEGELERNPLLERAAEGESESGPAEAENSSEEAGDWSAPESAMSPGAIEERLDTSLENVFPDDAPPAPTRPGSETPMAYSQWAGVGAGGREDGDYDL